MIFRSGLYVGCCFFFNDTATTEIYTLSLHDALPICILWVDDWFDVREHSGQEVAPGESLVKVLLGGQATDRKSTRLNSSHANISYAVFCLKKKIHNFMISVEHTD